jgi:hypothetical protein
MTVLPGMFRASALRQTSPQSVAVGAWTFLPRWSRHRAVVVSGEALRQRRVSLAGNSPGTVLLAGSPWGGHFGEQHGFSRVIP